MPRQARSRTTPQAAPKATPPQPATSHISTPLVITMAVASGLAAANLYYNQPLLVQIARTLRVPEASAGILPSLSQIGYALGLLLLVPLGDILERRSLIVMLFGLVAVLLASAALAPSFVVLAALTLAIGALTVMAQILLPFASQLSPPGERGRVIGTIMSGLLIGILLSRTISGLVGGHWGWRTMYGIAAALMLVIAGLLRVLLPLGLPTAPMPYRQLLRSLLDLARTQPVLREAALTGALLFAAFSAFWATLIFLLVSPTYHLGAPQAGLFGLVGAGGALAAPLAGRLADARSPRTLVQLAAALVGLAYVIFWVFGLHLVGLIIGVILLDIGVQAGHVSNQTRVFSLVPEAQSRLNTVYMVSYFVGGSLGSYLGALGWSLGQWHGVCAVGLAMTALLVMSFAASAQVAGSDT